jgi:predicted  nucleic acid-binding Zn-ribbon protein
VEKLQKESESLLEQYEKKAITFDDLESRFEKVQSKHKELKDRIALEELTVNR